MSVKKFIYLDGCVSTCGGCEAAVSVKKCIYLDGCVSTCGGCEAAVSVKSRNVYIWMAV